MKKNKVTKEKKQPTGTLILSKNLLNDLKIICVIDGISMKETTETLISDFIKNKQKTGVHKNGRQTLFL